MLGKSRAGTVIREGAWAGSRAAAVSGVQQGVAPGPRQPALAGRQRAGEGWARVADGLVSMGEWTDHHHDNVCRVGAARGRLSGSDPDNVVCNIATGVVWARSRYLSEKRVCWSTTTRSPRSSSHYGTDSCSVGLHAGNVGGHGRGWTRPRTVGVLQGKF
jgi:hypothetical protein